MVDRIYLKELGINPQGYKSGKRYVWPVGFVGNSRDMVELCEGDKYRTPQKRWGVPVKTFLGWVQGEGLVGLSEADTAVESAVAIELDLSGLLNGAEEPPLGLLLGAMGVDGQAVCERAVTGDLQAFLSLDAAGWQAVREAAREQKLVRSQEWQDKLAVKVLAVAADYLEGILFDGLARDLATFWGLYADGFAEYMAELPALTEVSIWLRVQRAVGCNLMVGVEWEEVTQ